MNRVNKMATNTASASIGDRVGYFAVGGLYGILSFAAAGFFVAYAPDQYDKAILFGWIASLFIASRILKSRFY